jgi:hypothetical protein
VDKPTLLLDETDTLFAAGKDDRGELLRSLLNAGFERKDRLSTQDLVKALVELDTENPWAIWWEQDISKNNTRAAGAKLAHRLGRFAIHARTIKLADGSTAKGFLRTDFEDSWSRYPILKPEKR